MDYEIIKYDEKYNEEIYEFQKELWTTDTSINEKYFRWKYFDNPFSESPEIYLVIKGNKLIGFRGLHAARWEIVGTPHSFNALSAADLHIHSEYRNQGIYRSLMNHIIEDLYGSEYQYIFNFTSHPVNYINSIAMGWKGTGEIKVIEKETQANEPGAIKLAKRILWKFGIAKKLIKLLGSPQSIDKIYSRYDKESRSTIVIENEPKPKEMAALVNEITRKDKITLITDQAYFRWRYDSPISKFLFLYYYDNGLKGYLVLENHDIAVGTDYKYSIFDLAAANSAIKIELLTSLLNIVNYGTIKVWENMLDNESYQYLLSEGFTEGNLRKSSKDYIQTILIRSLGKDNNSFVFEGISLLDVQNWNIKTANLND